MVSIEFRYDVDDLAWGFVIRVVMWVIMFWIILILVVNLMIWDGIY